MGFFGKSKSDAEREEEVYLREQKEKQKKERQLIRGDQLREIKGKMFGTEEHQYLRKLNDKENREIDFISGKRVPSAGELAHAGIMKVGRGVETGLGYVASTEAAKWAGVRAKGAAEYIPSKFEKARLDYEAGKISKKAYEEAYRHHKIDTAEARGSGTEQRHYREKVGKETEKLDREKVLKDIKISAEKAYALERAKTSGRIAARSERQTQFLERQQFEQQQFQQQRRLVPFYSIQGAKSIDPLGIFSLPRQRPQRSQQFQQAPQQRQQAPNMDFMNFLLGGGGVDKNGKRKKVYNIFLGRWE